MGIIDKIKEFFQKREKEKDAQDAIDSVKKAAQANNYNQASLKAYYALETMGEVYADQTREDHQTAREFVRQLTEEGFSKEDELEPIVVGFEVAKYSDMQVSFDDYAKIEKSLETVAEKLKSGEAKPKKKRRSRRRKPRKGRKTGASGKSRDDSDSGKKKPRFRRKND